MSLTALHIIELVKSLPFEERQAVRDALNHDPEQPVLYGEPLTDEDITESARVAFANLDALDAAHSLHGRFAGGNMHNSLLRGRARDRSAGLRSTKH